MSPHSFTANYERALEFGRLVVAANDVLMAAHTQ